jgi:hypothetical protein
MIRVILGRRRHGKTTLLIKLLSERGRPAIVVSFDKNIKKMFPAERRFMSARSMLRYIIKNNGVDLNRPLLLSIFTPEEFTAFCRIAIIHKNLLLLIDEADMFDSANYQDPEFRKIIHYGAHEFGGEGDLVVVARRPQDLSRDVRSQSDEFYIFRMTDDLELDYLKKNMSAELPARVRELRKFEHIYWDTDDAIELRRLPAPSRPPRADRREADLSSRAIDIGAEDE